MGEKWLEAYKPKQLAKLYVILRVKSLYKSLKCLLACPENREQGGWRDIWWELRVEASQPYNLNQSSVTSHVQVLVCNPSNVPVTGPSTFFQKLPTHLDCQELGLQSIHCSFSTGRQQSLTGKTQNSFRVWIETDLNSSTVNPFLSEWLSEMFKTMITSWPWRPKLKKI